MSPINERLVSLIQRVRLVAYRGNYNDENLIVEMNC